jgi:signal recognition particle receptor subunit beta
VDDIDVIVYVIDGSDRDQLEESGIALVRFLEEPVIESLINVPLLVINNKCDISGAMSNEELTKELHLADITKSGRILKIA